MKRIIEISGDGSHTLFVPELDEHYHSTRGAIQESLHVYIEAGLRRCDKQVVELLEIGFGTGLNAFLTLLETEKTGTKVNYTAVERYPIGVADIEKLNYAKLLAPSKKNLFMQLHGARWDEWMEITPNFRLKKLQKDVEKLDELQPEVPYDLVYYDAFAPEKQPGMWTPEIFNRLHAHCNDGAVLTTYCAKGAVRRMLQAAGYRVERLPGPPGKREMLRATK